MTRVRILPVCIFLAFLMLCVKSYELGSGLDLMPSTLRIAPLQAQEMDDPAVAQNGAAGDAAGANGDEAPLQESEMLLIRDPGLDPAEIEGGETLADTPPQTGQEKQIFQDIMERQRAYEERLSRLQRRENLLAATEQRIEEKIGELQALRQTIEGLVQRHEQQEQERIRALVKIYESMKPQDAARIFEELDTLVLLEVVERMNERRVAPILGEMTPARAKEITVELAQRRNLPIPKE